MLSFDEEKEKERVMLVNILYSSYFRCKKNKEINDKKTKEVRNILLQNYWQLGQLCRPF